MHAFDRILQTHTDREWLLMSYELGLHHDYCAIDQTEIVFEGLPPAEKPVDISAQDYLHIRLMPALAFTYWREQGLRLRWDDVFENPFERGDKRGQYIRPEMDPHVQALAIHLYDHMRRAEKPHFWVAGWWPKAYPDTIGKAEAYFTPGTSEIVINAPIGEKIAFHCDENVPSLGELEEWLCEEFGWWPY